MLRESVCGNAPIDLFTCFTDEPAGLGEGSRTWRSFNAANNADRWNLLRSLRRERHTAVAILTGESPLLRTWKVALAGLLPAKILLVDAHEGLVWIDRTHWRQVLRIAITQSGVLRPDFLRKAAQVGVLPVSLIVLLGFAAKVHLARLIRTTRFSARPEATR